MGEKEKYVVVLGGDGASKHQEQRCLAVKPESVVGVEYCSTTEHRNEEVCASVRYFPAFCDIETNQCEYGLRLDCTPPPRQQNH